MSFLSQVQRKLNLIADKGKKLKNNEASSLIFKSEKYVIFC